MQISFTGLNENIQLGRLALRQVRDAFPYGFISNTRYETFANKVNPKMDMHLAQKVEKTRDEIAFEKRLGYDGLTATENVVKRTGAANCGEQARILSKRLNENNIKNSIVTIEIRQGKKFINGHTFCVIGLENDAQINNPKTWGKDAVIADLWMNSVDKADKSLKNIMKTIGFDKKNATLIFHKPFIL